MEPKQEPVDYAGVSPKILSANATRSVTRNIETDTPNTSSNIQKNCTPKNLEQPLTKLINSMAKVGTTIVRQKKDIKHMIKSKAKKLTDQKSTETVTVNNQSQEIYKQRFNIRMVMQNSNATPFRNYLAGSGFVCCFCKDSFMKAADLKAHTIQNHDDKEKLKFMQKTELFRFVAKLDITALRCNLCEDELNTLEDLVEHLNGKHNKSLFTDIKNHILCFKFDSDTFTCIFCHLEHNSLKALIVHMNRHYRNYPCEHCDAGFINRLALVGHLRTHETGQFKCDSCSKMFDTIEKRRQHYKSVHTSILSYKCWKCGEKFSTTKKKLEHIRKDHGVKLMKLKCRACDRTFNDAIALRIHNKRDHLIERKHKCDQCDKTFFTSTFLHIHVRTHSDSRDFHCNVCSKAFKMSKTLKQHMLTHSKERSHNCGHCEKTFKYPATLRAHVRNTHSIVS